MPHEAADSVDAHSPRRVASSFILFLLHIAFDGHLTISATVPPDMRRDVQEIFRATPHHKQVMMFSATLAKDIRITCKKFMANVGSTTCEVVPVSDSSYSRSRSSSTMRRSSRCTVSSSTT